MSGNERDGDKSKDNKTSVLGQVLCVLGAVGVVACTTNASRILRWLEGSTTAVASTESGDGAVGSTESGDGNTRPCKRQKTNEGDGAAGAESDDTVEYIGTSREKIFGRALDLQGNEISVSYTLPGRVVTNYGTFIPKDKIKDGIVYIKNISKQEIPEKGLCKDEVPASGYVFHIHDPYQTCYDIRAFYNGGVILDDKEGTFFPKERVREGAVYREIGEIQYVIPDMPSP